MNSWRVLNALKNSSEKEQSRSGFSGWNLHFPTDGLLFREWNVHSMGVFLPNDRYLMDLRGAEVLRLRAPDDGNSIEQVLVYLLDPTRTGHHGRKYYIASTLIIRHISAN